MTEGKPGVRQVTRRAGIVLGVGWGATLLFAGAWAQAESRTPSPSGARVYFQSPTDGSHLPQRFTVRIGLKGMGVAPAGVVKASTGHHHLLIDADMQAFDRPIPSDYNHIHLGNGQTEVVVTLPPGRHTLQLLLGDQAHMVHDPPVMSEKITVYVR